ncbi:MAG: hypothetical protein GQF41_1619 [Candidatus Rifleibacterium amylolyticum]|nr:MAG: hypothetical protein GQF41_1619 [Candidatus Rifleibacterium amylolyticum]
MNDKFYQAAFEEIENGITNKGLWAKCFAEADGDKNKAEAKYVKARASQLESLAESDLIKNSIGAKPKYPKRKTPAGHLLTIALLLSLFLGFHFASWVVKMCDVFADWNSRPIGEIIYPQQEGQPGFDSETIKNNLIKLQNSDRWLTLPDDQKEYLKSEFAKGYAMAKNKEDSIDKQKTSDQGRKILAAIFQFASVAFLLALIVRLKTGFIIGFILLAIPIVGWSILFYLEYKQLQSPIPKENEP